jgi:hypothetical protein
MLAPGNAKDQAIATDYLPRWDVRPFSGELDHPAEALPMRNRLGPELPAGMRRRHPGGIVRELSESEPQLSPERGRDAVLWPSPKSL